MGERGGAVHSLLSGCLWVTCQQWLWEEGQRSRESNIHSPCLHWNVGLGLLGGLGPQDVTLEVFRSFTHLTSQGALTLPGRGIHKLAAAQSSLCSSRGAGRGQQRELTAAQSSRGHSRCFAGVVVPLERRGASEGMRRGPENTWENIPGRGAASPEQEQERSGGGGWGRGGLRGGGCSLRSRGRCSVAGAGSSCPRPHGLLARVAPVGGQ